MIDPNLLNAKALNMLAKLQQHQRDMMKLNSPDNRFHCELCKAIIEDDELFYMKKVGWFRHLYVCENCKQLGRN